MDEDPTRQMGARSYPYLRGLEYLRELSGEDDELATALVGLWGSRFGRAADADICDFGSGLGDLALRIATGLLQTHPSFSLRVESVDAESALADHARLLLERELGLRATSSGLGDFLASDRQFDLILVSHVLYYVDDRAALIANLLHRLRPGGLTSFVIRAERCDTFKLGSAIRSVEEPGSTRRRRDRVTETYVRERIEVADLSTSVTEKEMTVTIPVEALDVERAFHPGPASPVQELIRFLFHIAPGTLPSTAYERRVQEEIDTRRVDGQVRFSLVDALITAFRD